MANIKELTVEEKLMALYELQSNDSRIDKIKILRGELPLEVRDLEDEIAGLETRIGKLNEELESLGTSITGKNTEIAESKTLIGKYTEQQNKVRNNREFDSLTKEIEFQNLEIELSEKHIREFKSKISDKKMIIENSNENLGDRKDDLQHKKSELDDIIKETQKEEENLLSKSEEIQTIIEQRILIAYKRIRDNARNGLAVVPIQRDACGGCFSKIPPQRQLDIRSRKKIIVCDNCGRILVDSEIAGVDEQ